MVKREGVLFRKHQLEEAQLVRMKNCSRVQLNEDHVMFRMETGEINCVDFNLRHDVQLSELH